MRNFTDATIKTNKNQKKKTIFWERIGTNSLNWWHFWDWFRSERGACLASKTIVLNWLNAIEIKKKNTWYGRCSRFEINVIWKLNFHLNFVCFDRSSIGFTKSELVQPINNFLFCHWCLRLETLLDGISMHQFYTFHLIGHMRLPATVKISYSRIYCAVSSAPYSIQHSVDRWWTHHTSFDVLIQISSLKRKCNHSVHP